MRRASIAKMRGHSRSYFHLNYYNFWVLRAIIIVERFRLLGMKRSPISNYLRISSFNDPPKWEVDE
jgi:hypothetical protein